METARELLKKCMHLTASSADKDINPGLYADLFYVCETAKMYPIQTGPKWMCIYYKFLTKEAYIHLIDDLV